MGCHPADPDEGAPSGTPDISFYCDDIAKTVAELTAKGVEFTGPPADHGYGLVTRFKRSPAGSQSSSTSRSTRRGRPNRPERPPRPFRRNLAPDSQ